MKKYLGIGCLVLVLLTMTVCAFAQTWYAPTDEGIDLTITRTALSPTLWEWQFDLTNNSTQVLHEFTAGWAVDELAPWDAVTGHYQSWGSSVAVASATESLQQIRWTVAPGQTLIALGGGTGSFWYQTDLPFVGSAHYQARDGSVSGDWNGQPAPSIPEPMSMMLGFMGLGSVVGLRRFVKK